MLEMDLPCSRLSPQLFSGHKPRRSSVSPCTVSRAGSFPDAMAQHVPSEATPMPELVLMHMCWCRIGRRTARLLLVYLSRSWKDELDCFSGWNGFDGDIDKECHLIVRKNMANMSRLSGSGEQDSSELNVDRLGSLPWDILNYIFGKMTIVDAVKTSVLAKNWRYKWLSLCDFSLDSAVINHMLNHEDLRWDVVASIINKFLLHHTSSIRSFSLKTYCCGHQSDIYQWIRYLSQQDVEELLIWELTYNPLFKMPSYLFSFEKLRSLSLTNCTLRIPSTFGRFNWMDKISLRNVSICDADLARLIRSCPLLDSLILLNIFGLMHLRIHAPRLTRLMVDTGHDDIFIGAAPGLVKVSVATSYREQGNVPITNWHSMIRCLSNLGSLTNLSLSGEFIRLLAAEHYGLEHFPLRNDAVTSLFLHYLRFDSIEVFRICLSLLSTCHNIKCFRFSLEAAKGAKMAVKFFKENQGLFSFPNIEKVNVICPPHIGMGCAVNFIDFVISHCPKLRSLAIEKEGDVGLNNGRVDNMLSRFRKSCPHASIFLDNGGYAIFA